MRGEQNAQIRKRNDSRTGLAHARGSNPARARPSATRMERVRGSILASVPKRASREVSRLEKGKKTGARRLLEMARVASRRAQISPVTRAEPWRGEFSS